MFLIVWKVHKEKFVITIDSAILSKSYAHFFNTYIKRRQQWKVSCNFCEGTVRRTYSLLLAIFLCFEWRGICFARLSWWADYLSATWQMNFPAPLWNGRWCWVFYPPQSWRLYFQVLSDKKSYDLRLGCTISVAKNQLYTVGRLTSYKKDRYLNLHVNRLTGSPMFAAVNTVQKTKPC